MNAYAALCCNSASHPLPTRRNDESLRLTRFLWYWLCCSRACKAGFHNAKIWVPARGDFSYLLSRMIHSSLWGEFSVIVDSTVHYLYLIRVSGVLLRLTLTASLLASYSRRQRDFFISHGGWFQRQRCLDFKSKFREIHELGNDIAIIIIYSDDLRMTHFTLPHDAQAISCHYFDMLKKLSPGRASGSFHIVT